LVTRGVPQGSPLGPLLFSIFFADVVTACGGDCNLFADDTEFHVFALTEAELISQLNAKLALLKHYVELNKLELNAKKTVWMGMFGLIGNNEPVMYGTHAITRVSEFKYLGFTIDAKLSWNAHVGSVISKVRQRLYILRRSRFSVSTEGRMRLFNALIMPYFTYGIELWYAAGKTLRGTVELMFRHCLRIVVNDVGRIPVFHNVDLYVNLNVLPLSMTFQLNLAQMIFKVMK
jgi:hypothetical protein